MRRTMTVRTLLERAAELVEHSYTSGTMARRADGRSVEPTSRNAVRFCAVGAMRRVSKGRCGQVYVDAFRLLSSMCRNGNVMYTSDDSRDDILAAFRKAIRSCPS